MMHSVNALSASAAHCLLSAISNSALSIRAALCCTYVISDTSAKPSSFRPLMYACSSAFTLADGSVTASFCCRIKLL
jgi:hypothetical protein